MKKIIKWIAIAALLTSLSPVQECLRTFDQRYEASQALAEIGNQLQENQKIQTCLEKFSDDARLILQEALATIESWIPG